MGSSRLLPEAVEVTLTKPHLCSRPECRQVIRAGEKATKRRIEILGSEGEVVETVTCYVHPGECPPRIKREAARPKPRAIIRLKRPRTCHECRQTIEADQQATVWKPLGIRRKTSLYAHFPCCPPKSPKEIVTLDQPRLCGKCHRLIPAENQAVRATETVLNRWEEPIEVVGFRHHPSCPKGGRRVRYKKDGEISIQN